MRTKNTYDHKKPEASKAKPKKTVLDNVELFHLITEHVDDLIAIVDSKGKRLYNSPSYAKNLGYSKSLHGTDSFQEIHPEDRERIKKLFKHSMETGVGHRAEFRFLRHDGTICYVESQGSIIADHNGMPVQLLLVSRDITKRKDSEKSQQLITSAISYTKDCFCLTDLHNNFLFVNPAFCETYGYREEELIGKNISLVRTVDLPPDVGKKIIESTIMGGWNGEVINRRKDGRQFNVELWTSVVHDDEGTPIAFVGVARDVTERKRAEEALQKTVSLLTSTLESTADGILVVDAAGAVVTFNKKFIEIWRIPDTLVSSHDDKLFLNYVSDQLIDPEGFLRKVKSLYEHPEEESHDILLFKDERVFERFSFPQRIEGKSVGRVWSFHDITERKKHELQLRSSESKYRLLFESNPEPMWVYDLESSGFLAVNDAAVGRYGYTNDEFMSMTIQDILPQAEREHSANNFSQTPTGIASVSGVQHQKKDGSIIEVEILSHPIEFAGLQARLVTAKDITERRRIERLQEAVFQINQAADKSQNLDELFKILHGIILTVMPAKNFYIALYDEKEDVLSFPYFVDEIDVPLPPQKLGRGLTEYVLRTGKSLLCTKEMDGELQRQGEVELVGVQSPIWLGVPLIIENKAIGVMTVQHYSDPNAYGRDEQQILEFVSSQVAKVIHRKRAEEALRQGEERLRSLVTNVPVVLFAVDRDGIFTLSEGKGLKSLGLQSGEVVGKSIFEVYKNVPEIIKNIQQALSGKTLTTTVHVQGLEFESYYTPVFAGDETVTGVIGVAADVTERRRAEELQEAVYHITQAADQSRTLDELFHDVHEIIQTVMPAKNFYIALYDEKEEILSFPYFKDEVDVPPPPQKLGRGLTEYVLRTGTSLLCDKAMDAELQRRGEVEEIGVSTSIWLGVPLVIDNTTIGVMTVQHYSDQTAYGVREQHVLEFVSSQIAKAIQKKHSEDALRYSEEKYRTLFEESKDGIFISTPAGKLIDVNPAGVELFGYSSKDELCALDIANSFYYNPADRDIFIKKLTHDGFVIDFEYEIKTKQNERRTVLESASAITNTHNEIIAYRGFLRDITERKKLEDQLRQAQKMESIGTLAGGIAHDFNNLLGIILGYTSLLEDHSLDSAAVSQNVETIKKAVERGAGLVRQLLTFARKSETWFESVNANETVKEVAKMLSQTFPKSIQVLTELDQDIPSIVADSGQLHQALINLCVNSRDAILDHEKSESFSGTVTLRTQLVVANTIREKFKNATAKEYLIVSVHDNGVGMNTETRNRIFEPFFTTKELGKGTGLGLSVVYGVINNHHGFIDLESEVGKGTTFSLYFPVQDREIVRQSNPDDRLKDSETGSETILVVEDEEMLLKLVTSLLEERGYTVFAAKDGQEGIDIYREHHEHIACVLTDMGLPRLGGWEMFMKMKECNPSVKAILASGYCDPKIRVEMINEGAKDFIQKPYVSEIVLKRIREIIDAKPA